MEEDRRQAGEGGRRDPGLEVAGRAGHGGDAGRGGGEQQGAGILARHQQAREQGGRHDEAEAPRVVRRQCRVGQAGTELAERARETRLVDVPQCGRAGGASVGEGGQRAVRQARGALDAAVECRVRGWAQAPDAAPGEQEAGGECDGGHGCREQRRQHGQQAEEGGRHPEPGDRGTGSECRHQRLDAEDERGTPACGRKVGERGQASPSGTISSRQSCSAGAGARIETIPPRSTRKAAANGLAL